MGIDRDYCLAIGYEVNESVIEDLFLRESPEKSHMEPRWDPRTGERVADEKVIDERTEQVFIYQGHEFAFLEELLDKVCSDHDMNYWIHGWECDRDFVIGPNFAGLREDLSLEATPNVTGRFEMKDIPRVVHELERIKKVLTDLGLEVGIPVVRITCLVS